LKYVEFGIGNTWIIRTETEFNDGSEIEEKGIVRPLTFHSMYFRLWLGKTVFIIDSKDGWKKGKKNRNQIKILIGIRSL